ncbi:MAG: SIS domain-containing protein [Candidatus Eiseniibacteriota bacterium]|jgi:glucosamine--fructose-6-phosphate aminotransferase (isomerizing)
MTHPLHDAPGALAGEHICAEILEQPALVRRMLVAPVPGWPADGGRTLITGSGDSHVAAELVQRLLGRADVVARPSMEASAEAAALRPGDALIGISVSGRTPRVLEALLRARTAGARAVAVTDDPASPLASAADAVWLIGASPASVLAETSYRDPAARTYVGYHHDVAQTKTFLAALLTVLRPAAAGAAGTGATGAAATDDTGGPAPWSGLPALLDAVTAQDWYRPLLERATGWAAAGQAFCLGRGPGLALARFATYKLFEYNRIAHCNDLEEYCHTHYFVTRPGDAVVAVLLDEADAGRAAEILPVLAELFGARIVVLCPDDLDCPESLRGHALRVPAGTSPVERVAGMTVALQWVTYLWGRIGAPDINTFHAGYETERLVAASARTIRQSRIASAPPRPGTPPPDG